VRSEDVGRSMGDGDRSGVFNGGFTYWAGHAVWGTGFAIWPARNFVRIYHVLIRTVVREKSRIEVYSGRSNGTIDGAKTTAAITSPGPGWKVVQVTV